MKYRSKIKSQRGAITLYVLISMIFFLVVVFGIYFETSNKIQKQEDELGKIQKEYEKNNLDDIYEETYNNYVNTETPTIQAYNGETLKSEVIGEKVSSKKTMYLSNEHVTLKFLSKNTSDNYAYSTTANGVKTKIEGNTLDIDITTNGKTIYVYIEDNNGNYSKNYTAVTMILVTLQDKTIYVEEGKDTQIGEIQGENAGDITFGQVEDSTIIKLAGDTVTGLKAGTTTLIATEGKAGATATITVKVVKIELANTSGTMLVGDSRTVKITGINNGTLSAKTSDGEIATISLNNDDLIITAKKEGNATITITESNVKAETTYEIKVTSVTLTPNGGTYTMPTEGNAKIKTTVTTVNAEKIEVAWSDKAEEWNIIENNELVEKADCTSGIYYLYVRINEEAIYQSQKFIVGENTLEENRISITINKSGYTNEDITATVKYGSTITQNMKTAYGENLSEAQSASSSTNITTSETTLNVPKNGYVYAEATDIAGNKITASLQITTIDKTAPTVPTITYNSGSNECRWENNINITLSSSDNLTGIAYYEIDTNGDGNADTTTGWNFIPSNNWDSCNNRFRAVDGVGNRGAWSEIIHVHMDTQAPGGTGITYNSGSNECRWENNINITLSSSDNIGIAYYEIDWIGDGNSNGTTGSNFIPWNNYSSCNTRFRAVDHAGNRGAWSGSIHIHMDTESPQHTNWWFTQYDATLIRLYIQTTDNASGIARVTCSTSTATGGYNNWIWVDAVWDSGVNAYRVDMNPASWGHFNTTYVTHLYIWDNAGNGGMLNQTSCPIGNAVAYNYSTGRYYPSLASTISASSNASILMVSNTAENVTIPSGYTISLDLNGKTISSSGVTVTNNGTFTIGGSGKITTTSNYAVLNKNRMTMNAGEVSYTGSSYETALMNEGGKFIMNGGTIYSTAYGLVTQEGGNSDVYGGTIKSDSTMYDAVLSRTNGSTDIHNTAIHGAGIAVRLDGAKHIRLFDCNITGTVYNASAGGCLNEVVRWSDGFKVFYYDSVSAVSSVEFPTWTPANGLDDLIWYGTSATSRYNSRVLYSYIPKSNHGNQTGEYHTDVYINGTFADGWGYNLTP